MSGRAFLIVLPTYNERENLERIVDRILLASDDVDVLVIDDSSPDGTGQVARALVERSDRVHLLERPEKLGLGSAYLLGLQHSLSNGYRGVFTMDADNSHDPAVLPDMCAALDEADLVIGSRYVVGGGTDQKVARRVNSAVANVLARNVLDLHTLDCTSGYRVYSTAMLRRMPLAQMRSRGYSMLVELLCTVVDLDGRVAEVPISFRDRSHGRSKIGMQEIWESLRTIARLRRGRFGKARTRIANYIYRILPIKNKER